MARDALRAGHEVWTLTRGERPLPDGVRGIVADRRDRGAFLSGVERAAVAWDLVVDCVGFSAGDARQDLACFTPDRAGHLVFVSTDSVISPADRPWKIDERYDRFARDDYGAGKRQAEDVLLAAAHAHAPRPRITVLRPGHIYGPGSWLGPLPDHWRDPRLLERLRAGETLALVGGGHFLQQPLFAGDLWTMAESCLGNDRTDGEVYFAPGAEVVECRDYYRLVAEALGVRLAPIRELSVADHLRHHPGAAAACCHRVYATDKATAHGLVLPSTPLREGLRAHVAALESGTVP
jgi:nucleoside-diphosphate-sugar epimerase